MSRLLNVGLVILVFMLALAGCEFSASTANIPSVVLATDESGTAVTTQFSPDDTFYAIVELANAPDSTEVKAVWTAVDVGDAAEPGHIIDDAALETGSSPVVFDLTNDGAWPAGQYKVDIYLDGELDKTLEFNVEPAETAAETAPESQPTEVTETAQQPEAPPEETSQEDQGTASASGAATTLEEVQEATIRIVSQGSFIDPEFGEMMNAAGQGSGFIIDPSGIAVTNNHVVTGAAFLEVYLEGHDGPLNAHLLGVSECSDLAVIDIDGEGYPYLEWYDGDLNVGQEIYVAGFPLFGNEEYTLTRGIISKAQADGETNWASVDHALEIDATINGGDSGGPLVTNDGQVVGINYAGRDDTRQGFSISRDEALSVIDILRQGQDYNSIGINGQAVLSDDGSIAGIWVASVASGTPADNAGIKAGDIITQLEGLVMGTDGTMSDYCNILRSHDPGDVLSVEVLRFDTEEILAGQLNGRPLEQTVSFAEEIGQEIGDEIVDAEGYGEFMFVTDDSGALEVEIPTAWADIDGTAWESDGQILGPSISAAANLDNFNQSWAEPGMFFFASRDLVQETTVIDLLDAFDYSEECTFDKRLEYADPVYTGYYDIWNDCGGIGTVLAVLAATPEAQDHLAIVGLQIVSDADIEALDHILNSFIMNE
ncbi:MAG: S1C family serine protease [Candidatus Promineifilaceae bacterium]|jgi:serine protease Do